MSKSRITIDDEPISADPADWLHNPHAGEMLASEFMAPLDLDAAAMARLIGLPERKISDVVSGQKPMDAELDLRLGRYFGMSEGFFLGLQRRFELLEARRRLGAELDRIVPRVSRAA